MAKNAIGKIISVRQMFLYRWRTHHCPHGNFFFMFYLFQSFITGFYSFYDSNLPPKDANFFMNLIRISNLSDRHGRQTDRQKDRQTDTDRQTDGNLLGCAILLDYCFIQIQKACKLSVYCYSLKTEKVVFLPKI